MDEFEKEFLRDEETEDDEDLPTDEDLEDEFEGDDLGSENEEDL